jgi:hypothetical protein
LESGEFPQKIGRSSGGRTTKVYLLMNSWCLHARQILTGGNVAD